MGGQQVAARRHKPKAADPKKSVRGAKGPVDDRVSGSVSGNPSPIAAVAASRVNEVDFIVPAIGGDDVASWVDDEIAEVTKIIVEGLYSTAGRPFFQVRPRRKIGQGFVLFHPKTAPAFDPVGAAWG